MLRWRWIFGVVGWLTLVFASPAGVLAASAGDIELSPALVDLTLTEADARSQFELTLINRSQRTVTLELSVDDVTGQSDLVAAAFAGTTGLQFDEQYGLREWVALSNDSVILVPGETEPVTVTVTNQASLSPGGHYGVVRVTESLDERLSDERTVALRTTLTSFVFVSKVGGARPELLVDDVRAVQSWLGVPSAVRIQFHNSGNTHVIPRGRVQILDSFGRSVTEGILNPDSSLVLPESFRELTVPLMRTGISVLPGRYQVRLSYRMDGEETLRDVTTSVTIVPRLPLEILVLLLLLGGLRWLRTPRRTRRPTARRLLLLGGIFGVSCMVGAPAWASAQTGSIQVTATVPPSALARAGTAECTTLRLAQPVLTVGESTTLTGTLCDHRRRPLGLHQVLVILTTDTLRQALLTESTAAGDLTLPLTALASSVGAQSLEVWDTTFAPPLHLESLTLTVSASGRPHDGLQPEIGAVQPNSTLEPALTVPEVVSIAIGVRDVAVRSAQLSRDDAVHPSDTSLVNARAGPLPGA